jgi:hypothetical protein
LLPVFFGVFLAGTATAGASGIVTISVISIALTPLGLPVESILVIFMAIDPIIDPFRTLYLVYGNIATTAMIAGKKSDNAGTLTVIMRKGSEHPPVLYHDKNGTLCGYEIVMLEEIARRLGKSLKLVEGQALKGGEADMIGGFVVKTDEAPRGLSYSQPFAQIREGAKKIQLCFLITMTTPDSARINEIIKSLAVEKFLTKEIGKDTSARLAK